VNNCGEIEEKYRINFVVVAPTGYKETGQAEILPVSLP
jgi:hypothetical protein